MNLRRRNWRNPRMGSSREVREISAVAGVQLFPLKRAIYHEEQYNSHEFFVLNVYVIDRT
jgi:hypothetical protein